MNFLSHALPYLDRPYFVAGIATPDWLGVLNRKVRARSNAAEKFISNSKDCLAIEVARGVIQHHEDDRWFHGQLPFVETSMQFSIQIRDQLPGDAGFRPSFLGHILVELLMDDAIATAFPRALPKYYEALESLNCDLVESTVSAISPVPATGLALLIPHFTKERFLFDYADNERLLFRLNQVMRRVGLPKLPESLSDWFSDARRDVNRIWRDLLPKGVPR